MSIRYEPIMMRAIDAVREAGEVVLSSGIHRVRAKGAADFVTDVDVAVQGFLARQLAAIAPNVQFMGEEKDNSAIDPARPFWILDPVDGTTNLIHGLRLSAVSLAYAEGGAVRFGVVYDPFRGECYSACEGCGVSLNGELISVSRAAAFADALVAVGTVPGYKHMADEAFRQMRLLYDRCQDVRRSGCASLDLCHVAVGRLDAYVELMLQPWDYAAGALIVAEAGGRATTLTGEPLPLTHGSAVLAANAPLHPQLLSLLA